MSCTLVFGAARSGKSRYAEQLAAQAEQAEQAGKRVVYVATAGSQDGEMQQRIAMHRVQRPAHWLTVEQPIALAEVLAHYAAPDCVILVDCLTVWLSNCLFAQQQEFPEVGQITLPATWLTQRAALLAQLERQPGQVILVSNEVGMGIVPMGAISRCFVDESGRMNQAVAAIAEQVVWVAAGLPLYLKGSRPC